MYYVSRQHSWPDGQFLVEITSGGEDHSGPGMLAPKYGGEAEEYASAYEAAAVAWDVATAWQKDRPDLEIELGWGSTMGGLFVITGEEMSSELHDELIAWANARDDKAPKCDQCTEILGHRRNAYHNENSLWTGFTFCSEICAEKEQEYDDQWQAEGDAERDIEEDV